MKKLTINISDFVFEQMKKYCISYTGKKDIYFKDFIENAIRYYLQEHRHEY